MTTKFKSLIGTVVILAVVAIGGVAWLSMDIYQFSHTPAGTAPDLLEFAITPGESLESICNRLKQSGLITDTRRFRFLARLTGEDKRLQAGEYRLAPTLSPLALLDTLVAGDVFLHALTIPEGYTFKQIAAEIDRLQISDAQLFLTLAADPQVVEELDLEGQTLEGYLFPDTYHFPKGTPPRTVIEKMVQHFRDQFPQAWFQRAEELQMSLLEVVTLASIIEKETGDPSERPLISSVFHNRLRKRMRLETDPTVIYGLKDFNGNLTRKDLRTPTPYNTYVIKGLPPGPIANPGRLAIEAALFPADSNYLYFVAKKDGTHQFSTNIKDHNAAVRKYQLRRRSRKNK
jgi:UPF0755 protein